MPTSTGKLIQLNIEYTSFEAVFVRLVLLMESGMTSLPHTIVFLIGGTIQEVTLMNLYS